MRKHPNLLERPADDLMYTFLHAGVRPSFLCDAPRYKESEMPAAYEYNPSQIEAGLHVVRRMDGVKLSYVKNGWSPKYQSPERYSNSPNSQLRKDASFATSVLNYIHPEDLYRGLSVAQIVSAYSFYTSLIHEANAHEEAPEACAQPLPVNSFIVLAHSFSSGDGVTYECERCHQYVYQFYSKRMRVAHKCPYCEASLNTHKMLKPRAKTAAS